MNLTFTAHPHQHTLEVDVTEWDAGEPCIVLVLDGTNDLRTPVLTADEARELAMRLTLAAEAMEAG